MRKDFDFDFYCEQCCLVCENPCSVTDLQKAECPDKDRGTSQKRRDAKLHKSERSSNISNIVEAKKRRTAVKCKKATRSLQRQKKHNTVDKHALSVSYRRSIRIAQA